MRSADSGIVIQFVDGEAKCRARVRTASGYDVACDLNEYKNGGLGCSSGDTKVLGHACAHLMAVATKGGKSIEDFHPHHKTTAHLKEIMRAAGKYPTPPDEESKVRSAPVCFACDQSQVRTQEAPQEGKGDRNEKEGRESSEGALKVQSE